MNPTEARIARLRAQDTRTRADKLRELAEHPGSDPNEAAVAKALAEKQSKPKPPSVMSWASVAFAPNLSEFERRYEAMEREQEASFAEVMGPVHYAAYCCKRDERAARRRWHDEERARYPHDRERLRADAAAWMASLRPWDQVRTLHYLGLYDGPPLPSELLTVARRTPSGIVVMTDGTKWNPDGYRRGESGRAGYRTFIVAVRP